MGASRARGLRGSSARAGLVTAVAHHHLGRAAGIRVAADSRSGIGAAQPPPKHPATAEFRVIRAIGLTGTSRPFRWLLIALLVVALGLLSIAAFPLRALPDGPVAVMLLQRRAQLAIAGVWLLAVVAMVIAFT